MSLFVSSFPLPLCSAVHKDDERARGLRTNTLKFVKKAHPNHIACSGARADCSSGLWDGPQCPLLPNESLPSHHYELQKQQRKFSPPAPRFRYVEHLQPRCCLTP